MSKKIPPERWTVGRESFRHPKCREKVCDCPLPSMRFDLLELL
jgi:hypothetical protein